VKSYILTTLYLCYSFGILLKWILDTERGGGGENQENTHESVSQNFGQFSTFHKLTEQQIFISFSQSIYKRINTLFIYLT
jgi:hypothetical protein